MKNCTNIYTYSLDRKNVLTKMKIFAILLGKSRLVSNFGVLRLLSVRKAKKKSREWLSGRASPCQGEGRQFESGFALTQNPRDLGGYGVFFLWLFIAFCRGAK